MFQQAWTIEAVVLRTIGERAANGGARKRSIVQVLPLHREWREMPVVTAGNAGAVCICFLMAAGAFQTGHACASHSTHDVGEVTLSIIALLRVVRSSVAVNATRVS